MKRLQTNNFNLHYINALELPSTLEEHHITLTENGVYVFDLGSDLTKWDGKLGLNIYIKSKMAPTYIEGKEGSSFIESHLWTALPYLDFTESFYKTGLNFNTLDDFHNELNGMSNASIDYGTDVSYVSFPPEIFIQNNAGTKTLKINQFLVIVTDYITYFLITRDV